MSSASKIESMLSFLCEEVSSVLLQNRSLAEQYATEMAFSDSFDQQFELAMSREGALELVVSTLAFSDFLELVYRGILADDVVDEDELETAANLIAESVYRISWYEGYESFKYLVDGEDARKLLVTWMEDTSCLGGAGIEDNGGSFHNFVSIASMIEGSSALMLTYKKVYLLILKLTLDSGGLNSQEQALSLIHI